MNRRQRIILALVITLVFPVELALIFALDTLTGGIIWDLFMLIPASIIVAVGVYFLSFMIWDKTEQEAAEDGRPRTGRIVSKKQRILLTLMIAFVFPVSVALGLFLVGLASDNLAIWMLILTSIIVAVGVYFLSFTIWDKTEQEVQED